MTAHAAAARRTEDLANISHLVALVMQRVRQPAFWYVQAMILAITGAHYGLEVFAHGAGPGYLHHIPVILYIFPIIYAGLRYGWEGSLLTGTWVAVLCVPNIVFFHHHGLEWVVESTQIGVSLVVGVVVAMLVSRADAARRRAEELASRVERVNRLILRAQEDERLRIARDLHDGPVQTLVYLCHRLDNKGREPASNLSAIRAREVAESALTEVRSFSRDLRPSILDDLGLVAALDWLVRAGADQSPTVTELVIRGEARRLATETELALFRIAQESLRNVYRHAAAANAGVEMCFGDDGSWRLTVSDDGCGFDPDVSMSDLSARGNLGLNGMYERARLVGADLSIRTALQGGTVVTVAPLEHDRTGGVGRSSYFVRPQSAKPVSAGEPVQPGHRAAAR